MYGFRVFDTQDVLGLARKVTVSDSSSARAELDEIANHLRYEDAILVGPHEHAAREALIDYGAPNFTAWHLGDY